MDERGLVRFYRHQRQKGLHVHAGRPSAERHRDMHERDAACGAQPLLGGKLGLGRVGKLFFIDQGNHHLWMHPIERRREREGRFEPIPIQHARLNDREMVCGRAASQR